jgi:hypothetical protein
VESV